MAVAFSPCSDELDFEFVFFHLGGAEVAEDAEVGAPAQPLLKGRGDINATAHHDDVDVVAGTLQEDVANVTAHYIAFYSHLVGYVADEMKYFLVQNLG